MAVHLAIDEASESRSLAVSGEWFRGAWFRGQTPDQDTTGEEPQDDVERLDMMASVTGEVPPHASLCHLLINA